MLTRRRFIQAGLQGGTLLLCRVGGAVVGNPSAGQNHAQKAAPKDRAQDWLAAHGPIDYLQPDHAPPQFFGDDNRRPHQMLWDLPGFLAKHPEPTEVEETSLVIVGGGASGLFSAFELRAHKPIVLEQAPRLGGNAKGQSFAGIPFGLGSAYTEVPEPGTPMAAFFQALDLNDIMVPRHHPDPVAVNGKLYRNYWAGESDPQHVTAYKRLDAAFRTLNATPHFPLIVPLNTAQEDAVKHYDQWSLHNYLEETLAGPLPQQLDTVIEHYCWSTYAGTSRELSAAAVLCDLAKESTPICAGPGGNAAITERLVQRLVRELPSGSLRAGALVLRVRATPSHVEVLYIDAQDQLRKIRARTAIMACPKFVAARLIEDLLPERRAAIARLRYRAYLTCHALISKPMKQGMFDVYLGHTRKTDALATRATQAAVNATDVIFANWATPHAKRNVLSLYRALAYEGARAEFLPTDAYAATKKRFIEQIEQEILPLFGLTPSDVVDVRLALWGHALPLAIQGIYRDNTIAQLRAPHRDRIFFVEQDNWAYPAITTGATDSVLLSKQIRSSLA